MATMIPTVFLPLKLRNGNKYRCLKNHVFSVVEKKWICNEFSSSRIVPCYSNYDDLQPKHSFYVSHRRLESFSKRHHISLDGLKEWIHNFYGDGTFINHNGLCFFKIWLMFFKISTKCFGCDRGNDCSTLLFIKYLALGNVAGQISSFRFIVAAPFLPDDVLFVKEVHGLPNIYIYIL